MKSSLRDTLLIVALFAALIGFTAYSATLQLREQEEQRGVPYSSNSANVNGTLLLHDWLVAMGNRTERLEVMPLAIPDRADVLIVLPSQFKLTQNEVTRIERWVNNGHTLVLGTDRAAEEEHATLLTTFDIEIDGSATYIRKATVLQPVFSDLANPVRTNTLDFLRFNDTRVAIHVQATFTQDDETLPVLASFTHGKGRVIVTSAPFLFTNMSLREDGNAALVRGLFRHLPPTSVIAFEEAHRADAYDERDTGMMAVLTRTDWGRAVLFVVIAGFVYLAVNGRRFGRVLPLRQEVQRRRGAEYAISMANLLRRAGQRPNMAHHYARQLKLRLGRPYALGADLSDDEFVEQLRQVSDMPNNEDLRTLRAILVGLHAPKLDEADLLRWVQAADEFRISR